VFDSVLIANRGEIAVRVARTLRSMGVRAIAVYSDADAHSPHVRIADASVHLGPTPALQSYLHRERIIAAALTSGAQAIHPGYGFLSEDADFAQMCADAGLIFIGPPATVIAAMGDKIAAKKAAIAAGVPVVPGRHDDGMDDVTIAQAVREVGFPALLKPAAGGGGKGMRVIADATQIDEAITSARRESRSAFGDDTLLVERFVTRPRHVEVQVLADSHGAVVHLGERECTLQRRHQKVIEESPSPFLTHEVREALCASAVQLAMSVGYVNAGTVEYVVAGDDASSFAFLEMNTRLQVEHPVTELVTGLDLVEWQVRVAAGEHLSFGQEQVRSLGHAVEARIYAEDPTREFIPTGGDVIAWRPAEGVRVDSGIESGSTIGSSYDPMLAKVIAHRPTRAAALHCLEDALARTVLLGVVSNIDYLRWLVSTPQVRSGDMDTALLDRLPSPEPQSNSAVLPWAASALLPRGADSPWHRGDSWRLGGAAPQRWELDGREVSATVMGDDVRVAIGDEVTTVSRALPPHILARVTEDEVWLHDEMHGHTRVDVRRPIDQRLRGSRDANAATDQWIARSPMPGTVIDLPIDVGEIVEAGTVIAVVEAMKMEHALRAPWAGRVVSHSATLGDSVKRDAELVTIEPLGEDA